MKTARLRHRIVVEYQETEQDSETGAESVTWQTFAVGWADINWTRAAEYIAANAEQAEIAGEAFVWFVDFAGTDATMRILHEGMVYQILGVRRDRKSGREFLALSIGHGVRA